MIRDPRDLVRYTVQERANHWMVGITFILLGLSGLVFFHPAFFPLAQLFGGPVWTRILHPFVGVLYSLSFAGMYVRFVGLNRMTPTDWEWLKRWREMVNGNDEHMPIQGKYNGGQKLLFWILSVGSLLMLLSGLVIWRVYFSAAFPVTVVRLCSVMHALVATLMIAVIFIHIYAAIWTKGTIRAMWYGTVTRAWAKQHHRAWYRETTGDKRL